MSTSMKTAKKEMNAFDKKAQNTEDLTPGASSSGSEECSNGIIVLRISKCSNEY